MSIDAMKLALAALEDAVSAWRSEMEFRSCIDAAEPWAKAAESLRAAIEQPRQWQGLSPFDKTLLRTTYAPMKPLYYDKENDHSVCAEVATDWDSFFAAIESKLQERNT